MKNCINNKGKFISAKISDQNSEICENCAWIAEVTAFLVMDGYVTFSIKNLDIEIATVWQNLYSNQIKYSFIPTATKFSSWINLIQRSFKLWLSDIALSTKVQHFNWVKCCTRITSIKEIYKLSFLWLCSIGYDYCLYDRYFSNNWTSKRGDFSIFTVCLVVNSLRLKGLAQTFILKLWNSDKAKITRMKRSFDGMSCKSNMRLLPKIWI